MKLKIYFKNVSIAPASNVSRITVFKVDIKKYSNIHISFLKNTCIIQPKKSFQERSYTTFSWVISFLCA